MERSLALKSGLVFGLLLCTVSIDSLPVLAAEGDIIITRQVQPRTATRTELVPDPNPNLVNPNHQTLGAVKNLRSAHELSDGDFAGINSGITLPQRLLAPTTTGDLSTSTVQQTQSLPGLSATHTGGSTSGIAGQINRSVQQGLRPLNILGGQ